MSRSRPETDKRGIDPEDLADPVRGENLVGWPVGHHASAIQQDEPGKEVRRKAEIVKHREDRGSVTSVEIADQFHHLDLVSEIEVDRRLVEDEDGCVLRHRHRQQNELALPHRQLTGVAPKEVAHADPLDGRGNGRSITGSHSANRMFMGKPTKRDDLLDRRGEWQDRQLGHNRETSRHGDPFKAIDAVPAELHGSGRGSEQSGDHPQQG